MTLKRSELKRSAAPMSRGTPMARSKPLDGGGSLSRAAPMNRGSATLSRATPMNRGTSQMSRGTPMSRGSAELARNGPILSKTQMSVELPDRSKIAAHGPIDKARPARKRTLKTSRPKMTPIRASAKDEECTLRFPCCNYRTDTTVLCHRNGAGAGMKAEDTDAAYGCYACHMVLDGHAPRPEGFTRDMMLDRFNEAVRLTHVRLAVKGLINQIGAAEKGSVEKQKPDPVTSRVRLGITRKANVYENSTTD